MWLPAFGCILITQEKRDVPANLEECKRHETLLYEEEDPEKLVAFMDAFNDLPGVDTGV